MLALALACLTGSLHPPPCIQGSPWPADSLGEEIVALAEPLMERHDVPGLAVLLIRNGEVAWFRGVGTADREGERPITPDTVFNVGSVSKSVSAWGVMKLVEQGRVELDEPVETYLERWKLPRSRHDSEGVTVRRLLSHTAGLNVHGLAGFAQGEELPGLVELLGGRGTGDGRLRLVQAPGEGYRYSGGGYAVLQLLIEEVSGRPFADFMGEQVLLPLGMGSSSFGWEEPIRRAAARPHDRRGRPMKGRRFVAVSAAGLQTTPLDLARFGIASMGSHRAEADREVLGTDALRQMQRAAPGSPGYGLGYVRWTFGRKRVLGHTGGTLGWTSCLMVEPRLGHGLVLLSNGTNADRFLTDLEELWSSWLAGQREQVPPRDPQIGSPQGFWCGGFGRDDEDSRFWSWASLRFEGSGDELAAEFHIPFLEDVELELQDDRLSFQLEADGRPFRFAGRFHSETITGDYSWGQESGVLELVPVLALPSLELEPWNGIYGIGDGSDDHLFAVHGSGGVRWVTDFETGLDQLVAPVSESLLIGGPGRLRLHPVGVRLTRHGDDTVVLEQPGRPAFHGSRLLILRSQQVRFPGDGVELAGRWYQAPGRGPHPGVVLVQGSGPEPARDGYGFWPSYLTWLGFDVLAYDKRGTGASEGEYPGDGAGRSPRDKWGVRAGDVRAAAEWLRGQDRVRAERVGLLGFSQAGWVMPLASRDPGIAFTITVNGGATPISVESRFDELGGELVRSGTVPELEQAYRKLARYRPKDTDFLEEFRAQSAPGLWLYGGLDRVNPSRFAVRVVREAAASAERDFTVVEFETGNHSLHVARIGNVAERGLTSHLVPGLLGVIERWLAERELLPR